MEIIIIIIIISHLFFADDLILFVEVEEKACEAISEVLNRFCVELGQNVSLEKSRIYFSPNVQEGISEDICSKLGIQATTNMGWKAKFLSFVGRTVLVKSVMLAIPNDVMQGEALPIHLCEKSDKINRDFLWVSIREKKKLHLIGWSKIIKPKEEGGLGIQAAREKNLALLAKLNWRMYKEKEALWANVILKKYCSVRQKMIK